MKKLFTLIVAALLGGGGYLYKQGYRVDGIDKISLKPSGAQHAEGESAPPPVERQSGTIRVGSFNIQVFGTSKIAKPPSNFKLSRGKMATTEKAVPACFWQLRQ